MTTFPALSPAARVFTPGDYPHSKLKAYSGRQTRIRHSDAIVDHYEPGQWWVKWCVNATSAGGTFVDAEDRANFNLSENQWHHLALQITPSSISLYFRGSRIANLDISGIAPVIPSAGAVVYSTIEMESCHSVELNPDVGRCAIQGYRFTAGQELYSGATITPPTSITTQE